MNAATAGKAEGRVYGVLFTPEDPEKTAKEAADAAKGAAEAPAVEEEEDDEEDGAGADVELPAWLELLNPNSLVVEQVLVEPCLAPEAAKPKMVIDRPVFQFQRVGFFCIDNDSSETAPIFNRIVALKEDKEKKGL